MPQPTGKEVFFGEDEIIVSKTDLKGLMTYANDVFLRVAGYTEAELLGANHNIIRHPAMPRCVFKLLWDVITDGREIFAYVLNMAKNGDHYWVYAHVTPTFDPTGRIIGYHSNRRVPNRHQIAAVEPIYKLLLDEEAKHSNRRDGMAASGAFLGQYLEKAGVTYDEFIWSV